MSISNEEMEIRLAVLLLDGQPYAVDIMKIKQIIRPMKITPLPDAPGFVEGMINLRGVVIPVVDMRKRFGLKPRGEDEEEKVIIVGVEGNIVGIIVDEVTEVVTVKKSEIQPPPGLIRGVKSHYLLGVFRYLDDILLILNLDEILTAEEKIDLGAMKEAPAGLEERR